MRVHKWWHMFNFWGELSLWDCPQLRSNISDRSYMFWDVFNMYLKGKNFQTSNFFLSESENTSRQNEQGV